MQLAIHAITGAEYFAGLPATAAVHVLVSDTQYLDSSALDMDHMALCKVLPPPILASSVTDVTILCNPYIMGRYLYVVMKRADTGTEPFCIFETRAYSTCKCSVMLYDHPLYDFFGMFTPTTYIQSNL